MNYVSHSTGLFLTTMFSPIRYYTLTHFSFWPVWQKWKWHESHSNSFAWMAFERMQYVNHYATALYLSFQNVTQHPYHYSMQRLMNFGPETAFFIPWNFSELQWWNQTQKLILDIKKKTKKKHQHLYVSFEASAKMNSTVIWHAPHFW